MFNNKIVTWHEHEENKYNKTQENITVFAMSLPAASFWFGDQLGYRKYEYEENVVSKEANFTVFNWGGK